MPVQNPPARRAVRWTLIGAAALFAVAALSVAVFVLWVSFAAPIRPSL